LRNKLSDSGTKKGAEFQRGALGIGLLLLLAGCHPKNKIGGGPKDPASGNARLNQTLLAPGKLAAIGKDTIITECEHESYVNASSGLIVEEAGLHEDVFSLRDRNFLTPNAYNLDEALRLEGLLREEARVRERPAKQADCIDEFAGHFEGLTDSLVQADKVQKELDMSAFKDASKQAEDQLEKTQHEAEHPTAPNPR
jgi:hypothetical protein